MADYRRESTRGGRFPPAAARKWQPTPAKSMFFPAQAELPAVKDYMDELLAIPKSVTPLSPEQWNSAQRSVPRQQAQPARGVTSHSLHFSTRLHEISKSTSQLAQSVREAVMPLDLDGSRMMNGSEVGEEEKEVVVN